ncbi:hypothetical protein NUW58_g47 [Xylaria curta]|uniref:Uncharacterized protein n=2 Tax=Xylaria curta TaxID=42375 RepID=A0ACC1NM56_9PEZI|nr:hypothetical protein NUW58_g6961 [Xylaria curta]KAJ2999273.1 hypothetical protein NUW58_g47 [Xylaria curta]
MQKHPTASTLLSFALAAVEELRKVFQEGAQPGRLGELEPFFTTLDPLLSCVEVRLDTLRQAGCPGGSDAEKKVLRLITVMEILLSLQWPSALKRSPKTPFKPSDYPSLDDLVNSSQQTAKTNIQRLAKSKHQRAVTKREKFQTSFKAFANSERIPRGPSLSDLITTSTKPATDDNYTACLRLLHATLCQYSHPSHCNGGSFMANVALTRVRQLEKTKEKVPFDFFFLHRHLNSGENMWKRAQIRVFPKA